MIESNNLLGWSNLDQIKINYFNECERIASDDMAFSSFKINKNYIPILEHVSYDLGMYYLNLICQKYKPDTFQLIMKHLDDFKSNDKIGSPLIYEYPLVGTISPTTLRYIKTLMDIVEKFDINGANIVEIGGGYGGQCLILSKIFNFKTYTILDLESVNKLQKRYLHHHNLLNTTATTIESAYDIDFDFVISNYAFSELNKRMQDDYLRIIKKCSSGYFQINPDASECYNREELINIFKRDLMNVEISPDEPMNNFYPNNFICTFSNK